MTLLIIEEAYNGILQSGVVAIVLMAGCILMYRHFTAEMKELNREIGEPQGGDLTNDEALEYIKQNHVEPEIEDL